MGVVRVAPPFEVFPDVDGDPLENGYIYVGQVGLNPEIINNQLDVYWDPALTITAVQPIRTTGGFPFYNGSPANIYIDSSSYSIVVRNKNGSLIYSNFSVIISNISFNTPPSCKSIPELTGAIITLVDGSTIESDELVPVANTGFTIETTINNVTSQKGGGAYYIKTLIQHRIDIADPSWVPDGFGDHYLFLSTTYVAVLLEEDHINILQYGALSTSNDSSSLQACINKANSTNGKVYFPEASYTLEDPILFYSCSLVGESQRGVAIACNATTPQFVLQETWQYAECRNIRFNGTGASKCFDGETTAKGFFGLNIENCRFTNFTRAFDKYASLFCIYNNVQFRFCGRGLNFNAGSGTYHNVNQLLGCYFDEADEHGIYFDSASNGSSLSIINTAFDHCAVGVYAGRPVELLGECYFERDAVGIHAVNTNVTHGRLYMLGQSSGGTDIGIHLDNSTLIQLGIASFTDTFGNGKVLGNNNSLVLNVAGTSQNNYILNDTSSVIDYKTLLLLVSAATPAGPAITTVTDLSTTPVNIGSGRFSNSCQYTLRMSTVALTRVSLQFGLTFNATASVWRAEAHALTGGTLTRISANSWSISALGDGRTYTFSISGANGQMTVVSDAATVGDTIFTVQGCDKILV